MAHRYPLPVPPRPEEKDKVQPPNTEDEVPVIRYKVRVCDDYIRGYYLDIDEFYIPSHHIIFNFGLDSNPFQRRTQLHIYMSDKSRENQVPSDKRAAVPPETARITLSKKTVEQIESQLFMELHVNADKNDLMKQLGSVFKIELNE